MKKFGFKVALLAALLFGLVAVQNASAFQLGVLTGAAPGAYCEGFSIGGGEVEKERKTGCGFNFFVEMPHNYGESNWFGQVEVGYVAQSFDVAYNVGYQFHLGDKFILAPFGGVTMATFFLMGFGVNVGVLGRFPLGIGDLTADIRYNPTFGLFDRQCASIDVGYIFLFGKHKR